MATKFHPWFRSLIPFMCYSINAKLRLGRHDGILRFWSGRPSMKGPPWRLSSRLWNYAPVRQQLFQCQAKSFTLIGSYFRTIRMLFKARLCICKFDKSLLIGENINILPAKLNSDLYKHGLGIQTCLWIVMLDNSANSMRQAVCVPANRSILDSLTGEENYSTLSYAMGFIFYQGKSKQRNSFCSEVLWKIWRGGRSSLREMIHELCLIIAIPHLNSCAGVLGGYEIWPHSWWDIWGYDKNVLDSLQNVYCDFGGCNLSTTDWHRSIVCHALPKQGLCQPPPQWTPPDAMVRWLAF